MISGLLLDEPRRASGHAETDWLKASPQGDFARLGKDITITEDVRKFAAEQGIAEQDALADGMAMKASEFAQSGISTLRENHGFVACPRLNSEPAACNSTTAVKRRAILSAWRQQLVAVR